MLSKRLIKIIGLRVRVMATTGQTIYGWDATTSQLTLPDSPYMYWTWRIGVSSGYLLGLLHAIELYTRLILSKHDLEDEAVLTVHDAEEKLQEFAKTVIEIGELILILVFCTLDIHIGAHRADIKYLFNQLIHYYAETEKMLETRQIELDENHKKKIRGMEWLAYLVSVVSYLFPCIMMVCIFSPLESTHVLLKEWMEFEVTWENMKWIHCFFGIIFWSMLQTAGNTVLTFGLLVMCYFQTAYVLVEDMTAVQVRPDKQRGSLCNQHLTLETTSFGAMSDDEVVHLYRTQQMFLTLLNEIMAAFPVSVHHVGTLATASIMVYFAIKFSAVLQGTGMVGWIIVIGAVILPCLTEFVEAEMIGTLADISIGFKENGVKLTGRGTVFHKFVRSCPVMYIQEAYPYYNIDQTTFLEFGSGVANYAITLLLW